MRVKVMTEKSLDDVTRERLLDPIGMKDSYWFERLWCEEEEQVCQNRMGFASTLRDLARFGQLILDGGSWQSEQLFGNPDYLSDCYTPSDANPGYGLLWWLNQGDPPRIPAAPSELLTASGALDREIWIVPSMGLVIVRIGDWSPDYTLGLTSAFWELLAPKLTL